MTPLLPAASRPRQLAAGGDAPASRDLVQLGQGGTPPWPLTETTDDRVRSSRSVGCPAIGAQRLPAGRVPGTTALLAVSMDCQNKPLGCSGPLASI